MRVLTLTMDHEKAESVRLLLEHVSNGMNQAISGAINKTLPHLRAGLVDDVKAHMNAKAAQIRKAMTIRRAGPRKPVGQINISSASVKAIEFPHTGDGKGGGGVDVQFGPDDAQHFPHAFVATMPSGNVGIFERIHKGAHHVEVRGADGKMHSTGRPIRELYGPTVQTIIARNKDALDKRLEETDQWLDKQMESQVDRLLNRKKPDTGEGES
jgi:hypothetical protein